MNIRLDFTQGELVGFFKIYSKSGNILYGKTLWKHESDGFYRVNLYAKRINSKTIKAIGEARPYESDIEKIVISARKY